MKKTRKRILSMLVILCMVTALLAGCGSSTDTSAASTSNSTAASTSGSTSTSASTSTEAAPAAEEEKTVVWISNSTVPNLDKYNQTGSIAPKLAKLWGDSLVESDHEGNYIPMLAESVEFSDDYLTCTIKLREGITFNNGEPLTADDVAFTFERIQSLTTWNASKWTAYLDTVEAVDDLTAVIHFATLMPTFYTEASSCSILNRDAYDAMGDEAFWLNPVGVGAYTVESFDDMSGECVFVRNDSWWGWEHYGETSNVDVIDFKVVTEDTTRVSALRSGEADLIEYVPNDDIEVLTGEGFQAIVSSTYEHVTMNISLNGVFADKNLRQALSECIDRELLVETVVGGGTAANYPCNPGTMGYNADASYTYDLDHAKALVEASDYDGSEIRLIATQSMTRVSEVAQAIQAFGSEIGLNIGVYVEENSTYNDDKSAGSYDLALTNMGTNAEDNNMEVAEVIGTDRFKSGFDNEELVAVCAESMQHVDTVERAGYYQQAYDIVMEEFMPVIALYYNQSCIGYNSAISNIHTYVGGGYDIRFMQMA